MEKQGITSREVEAGLDHLLNSFAIDGTANEKGAVLIKQVPSSKLRKSSSQTFSSRTPIPTKTCQASSHVAGVYKLSFNPSDETIQWVPKGEPLVQPGGHLDLSAFLTKLDGGAEFGQQCSDLRSTPQGLRQALQINSFPVSAPDVRLRELCQRANATHIYGSYIHIATAGSPLTIRSAFASLTTIYFHHRGRARRWVVIPPRAREAFENRILKEFDIQSDDRACDQFIHHMKIWIQPSVLKKWGIPYYELIQKELQLIFFFPGSYYYGYSEGFSIIESKMHGGDRWDYSRYKFCSTNSEQCRVENMLVNPEVFSSSVTEDGRDGGGSRRQNGKRKAGKVVSPECPPKRQARERSSPNPAAGSVGRRNSETDIVRNDAEGDRAEVLSTILVEAGRGARQGSFNSTAEQAGIVFDISDDDDNPGEDIASINSRVFKLQQENAAILRDLAVTRSERDGLRTRKAMYKSRLLEREGVIVSLEKKVADLESRLEMEVAIARKGAWEEMMLTARKKMEDITGQVTGS